MLEQSLHRPINADDLAEDIDLMRKSTARRWSI